MFDEVAFVLGVTSIFLGVLAFRRTRTFIARCQVANGRITAYTSEESDEGVSYYSEVAFGDRSGLEHRFHGSVALKEPPAIGARVRITYDGENPENAWVTGSSAPWVIPWLVLLVGVGFVAAGFVIRAEGG